ncbi:SIT4 phosphatase-associated protein-domain-containing protein [Infundibulicybe gibba]|nr:SIT4 phosphatase-associated protein-domain-containing protein [Infundibulicybe gibba]
MFWRFGFHNGSAIDSLLDKEDVSLEAILDEDDLLQECKSQNTRLLGYFQRVDVLQRLLAYVTGQIEGEEKGRFKYPYVATEVLCSEIWSIVETCVNEQAQLLIPFWETVLETSPDDMKTQMIMASHFAKINAVFLTKKPAEMLAFIQSQPSVVQRLLNHVETPSFVDLLVRIIQLDENPSGAGVLEWLSSENFMGRLIELLSPEHTSDIHAVVAELIKGIISMATPSPGAGLTEGLQNGPASNRFARELAHKNSISTLVSYILHDFGPSSKDPPNTENSTSDTSTSGKERPSPESSTSSVVHSISIIIELIRKNNSDYFEPYLFHTLRNRLIQVQQQMHLQSEDSPDFQRILRTPRSLNGPILTTVGPIIPLTFERYRICELFAELLHCSNMSLLNRPAEYNHLYDNEGRLQGGLSALEELAQVITLNTNEESDRRESMDESNDEQASPHDLPVTNHSADPMDSDEDMSDDEPGSSDDDAMEEIVMYDEPQSQLELSPSPIETSLPEPSIVVPSSPNAVSLPPASEINSETRSHGSRRSSRRAATSDNIPEAPPPIGEKLKRGFLDTNVLSSMLDLFFEFPWNNFLHSAVYDLVHQVLTGHVESGLNRELAIGLFRDARLMYRIVEGQKRNDAESTKQKGIRLGYMGHLTLISEDVIMALERFPPELRLIIIQYAPDPEWDQYVTGRYNETRKKDTRLLGGGKPVVAPGGPRNIARWKVDDEDPNSLITAGVGRSNGDHEPRGEFRRAGGPRPTRETSADFGPASMDDDDDDEDGSVAPHFAQYLAQEMHASDHFGSSESDDDDDDGGWLAQSTFSLSNPPVSARHQNNERRPLEHSGFDDTFDPSSPGNRSTGDPFSSDNDDTFGPFSDAGASDSDPFTFSSSFSDETEDASFESFGDFGEFQSPHDGELTPTAGSWTFTSEAGTSDEAGSEGSPSPRTR